jgi:large subunit ribosomal protein L30
MKKLKVILKKSPINRNRKHQLTLKALGLRKIGKERVFPDNPAVRGMINKVAYLLDVQEVVDETE